jgi:hypothetical protein
VAGLDVWLFCKSRGLLTEGNKSKQMHQYATSSPTTVFWFVLTQKSASQRSLGINCDISFCTVGVFSRVGVVVESAGNFPITRS